MRRAIILLALGACTHRHTLLHIEKQEQLQDFEAPNTYERCKPACAARGLRVIESW